MAQTGQRSRLAAYAELTKLRISAMVLLTYVIAGLLAAGGHVSLMPLIWGTVAMALIASSGNALNMYLERYTDFLMPRTAGRPLPARRLSANEVVLFAVVCFGVSIGIFFTLVNWQTGVCALLTWILYVFVYTPLKTRTWLNTEIGAIPGALPILMGALTTTGRVDAWTGVFFGVLLLWQFPHFMAIAWRYRDQYRAGGHQMLTVVDPSGRRAGRKAIATAILVLGISLIPVIWIESTAILGVYAIGSGLLGIGYLYYSILFARDRNDQTARRLLRYSILYLPLYMSLLVAARTMG